MPDQSAREIYPFSQILEIPDMQPDVEAEMDCGFRAAVRGDDGSGTY